MPILEGRFRKRKKPVNGSWRMDETYITAIRNMEKSVVEKFKNDAVCKISLVKNGINFEYP